MKTKTKFSAQQKRALTIEINTLSKMYDRVKECHVKYGWTHYDGEPIGITLNALRNDITMLRRQRANMNINSAAQDTDLSPAGYSQK